MQIKKSLEVTFLELITFLSDYFHTNFKDLATMSQFMYLKK